MFVILNVSTGAKEKGITAGIAVGSVVALEAMFAGPITGASMNPARSLGPALLSDNFSALWVYLAARRSLAFLWPSWAAKAQKRVVVAGRPIFFCRGELLTPPR